MENYEKKNRIGEALQIRNMKQVDLCEKANVSKASLSHWVKQDWQPKQKPLMAMAKVLNVSEMWLAGYDIPMERPVEQVIRDKNADAYLIIRQDERMCDRVILMNLLTEEQKASIDNLINLFTGSNRDLAD